MFPRLLGLRCPCDCLEGSNYLRGLQGHPTLESVQETCEHVSYRWCYAHAVLLNTRICCSVGGAGNLCLQDLKFVLMLLQLVTLLRNLRLCSLKGLHGTFSFSQDQIQSFLTAGNDTLYPCLLLAKRALLCQSSSQSKYLLIKTIRDICRVRSDHECFLGRESCAQFRFHLGQIVFLCSNVHLLTRVGHLPRFVCGSSGFLSDISAAPVALSLSGRVMTGLPPCGGALAAPLVGHPVLGLAMRASPHHGRSAHREEETKQRSLDCVGPRTLVTHLQLATRSLTAASVA